MISINKRAFTLIELLVVIAIIGILSALIVVGMSSTTQKATIAKAQVFSNSLRNSLMGNLVSEWKFDQVNVPAANQTPDSWGGGNTGTLYGSGGSQNLPQLQTTGCVSGNCLSFDSTDDYVDCGTGNSLDITSVITVSVWVKTVNTAREVVIGKLASSPINGFFLDISGATQGYPRFIIYNNGSSGSGSSSVAVIDGNWHNLVGTYNGSNDILYVDGTRQPLGTNLAPGSASAVSFKIGIAWDASSYKFIGSIDDVRIFNVAVPTSQIQQNYFVGLNKLFAKQGIESIEYQQRLAELSNNYAKQ